MNLNRILIARTTRIWGMNLKAIVSHMVKTKSMIYNQERDPRHPNDKKARETPLENDDEWMMLYVD